MAEHSDGNASALVMPLSRESARDMLLGAALSAPADAASDVLPRELLIRLALDSPRAFAAVARVWKWLARLCHHQYVRSVVAYIFKCPAHLTNVYRAHDLPSRPIDIALDFAHDHRQAYREFCRVAAVAGEGQRHEFTCEALVDVTLNPNEEQLPYPVCCVTSNEARVASYGGGVTQLTEYSYEYPDGRAYPSHCATKYYPSSSARVKTIKNRMFVKHSTARLKTYEEPQLRLMQRFGLVATGGQQPWLHIKYVFDKYKDLLGGELISDGSRSAQ